LRPFFSDLDSDSDPARASDLSDPLGNFAVVQNLHNSIRTFVVFILHDLADVNVARIESQRIVGARVNREPILVVYLLPPCGELRIKSVLLCPSSSYL